MQHRLVSAIGRSASNGAAQASSWEPLPVPQWQTPLERAHEPGPSSAA